MRDQDPKVTTEQLQVPGAESPACILRQHWASAMEDMGPDEGLREVVAMRLALHAATWLAVRKMRAHKASWTEIGAVLGVSRQAAHERYATADERAR